jgi:hypothetical protein
LEPDRAVGALDQKDERSFFIGSLTSLMKERETQAARVLAVRGNTDEWNASPAF